MAAPTMSIVTLPVQTGDAHAVPIPGAGQLFPGSCLYLQFLGAFVAHYIIQGSVDGATWFDMTSSFDSLSTGESVASPITAPDNLVYGAPPPFLRVRCEAYTSGTPSVALLSRGLPAA
jgi:hypothetical protein